MRATGGSSRRATVVTVGWWEELTDGGYIKEERGNA